MIKASPAKSPPPIDTQTWMQAVEEGDAARVKSLLAEGADVNAISSGGKTALMRAAARGYTDIVKVLLDAGADVDAKKENGSTALVLAVFFGHTDVVRVLLSKGADPAAQTPQGTPTVEWAQFIGFTEIVELLRNAEALRARNSTQGSSTNSEQVVAEGLFRAEGPIHPVVPLSKIDEEPTPLIEEARSEKAFVAEAEERQADDDEESDRHEYVVPEEVTIVRQRIRRASGLRPLFAARSLRPWHASVLSLVVLLIAGLILDARWKSLTRSANTEQSAPLVNEASPIADDKTPSTAPQSAPQLSDKSEPGAPPSATTEKNLSAKEEEAKPAEANTISASSTPPVISEGRRPTNAAPPVRHAADATTSERDSTVSTHREKQVSPARTDASRRAALPERRAPKAAEGRVQTSTSPTLSLPVAAPPPAKSEQKKVIPWP
jgi:cytoskeletal protein RodZ